MKSYLFLIFNLAITILQQDGYQLYSLLKSIKTCDRVILQEDTLKIDIARKPRWTIKERDRITEELQEHGFSYNQENDTIMIHLSYVDYLVGIPVNIGAYSSLSKIQMEIDSEWNITNTSNNIKYSVSSPRVQIQNAPIMLIAVQGEKMLLSCIKNNDTQSLQQLFKEYSTHALDGGPDVVMRIEIKDNMIKNCSERIYEINFISYANDKWKEFVKN